MDTVRCAANIGQPTIQPISGYQWRKAKHDKNKQDLRSVVDFLGGYSLHINKSTGVETAKAQAMEQLYSHVNFYRHSGDPEDKVTQTVAEYAEGHDRAEAEFC